MRMTRLLFILSLLLWAAPFQAQNRNLTGSITATSTDCSTAGSCVVLKKLANDGAVALQITGTYTATLQFEGSADYATTSTPTWLALSGVPYSSGASVTSTTGTGGWTFGATGLTGIRVRASAYTSGTASIELQAGSPTPGGASNGGGTVTSNQGGTWNMTPLQASFTDRSGSISVGGTSQTLAASNANRKRIVIQNPCTATSQGIATAENLFLNFTSAATTAGGNSIELQACGSYDSGLGPVTTEQINVIAATTNHKYVAKEE